MSDEAKNFQAPAEGDESARSDEEAAVSPEVEEQVGDEPETEPGEQPEVPEETESPDVVSAAPDVAPDPAPESYEEGDVPPTPVDEVAEEEGVPASEQQAVFSSEAEPRVDLSPDSVKLAQESADPEAVIEELVTRADPTVEPSDIELLPPSEQPEAQGKTGQAQSDREYRQEESAKVEDQATLLVQRPAVEQEEQTYSALGAAPVQTDAETGEPVAAGTAEVGNDPAVRVTGGDYHKPGSPLPPETEQDQQPYHAGPDAERRAAKYEGFADEDVPEDVREYRAAQSDDDEEDE